MTCLELQSFCHALRKNLKFKLLYFQNKECYPAENKLADGNLDFLICDEDKNPKLCLVMNFSFFMTSCENQEYIRSHYRKTHCYKTLTFPFEVCILECIIYVTFGDPYRAGGGANFRWGQKICNFPVLFFQILISVKSHTFRIINQNG